MRAVEPPVPNRPLEYQSRAHAHANGPTFSVPTFLITLAGVAPLSLVLLLVVPKFAMIFADFKAKLPPATEVIIGLSKWYCEMGWLLGILLPVIMGFVGARVQHPGRFNRSWRMFLLWFSIIVMGLIGAGLFLPMTALIDAVTGK